MITLILLINIMVISVIIAMHEGYKPSNGESGELLSLFSAILIFLCSVALIGIVLKNSTIVGF